MAQSPTVYVDELIDRQSLTPRNYLILGLLLIALLCDGFDLQLLAFAAPRLAKDWGIAPQALGPVLSANLLGMMFGAMFLGRTGDRFGRKRVIVVGTILYGLTSLGCLLVHSLPALATLRFLTGMGLGGVLPNVIALTAEITPAKRRAALTSVPIIGMSLGSGMPSFVAAWLVPHYGWQALFVVGGLVPLLIALLLALALPESLLFLAHRGSHREQVATRARALDPGIEIAADTVFALRGNADGSPRRGGFKQLFAADLGVTTPLLWVMFACTLLSMHFINSWMSVILNSAGLSEVQTAFTNLALHWGGTIAALATALLLGRMGLAWILALLVSGLVGVFTIATTGFASATLLTLAVCLSGFGIIGCQGALNAAAGLIYPVSCRPTGVGAALGVGRVGSLSGPLVGSYFLGIGMPVQQMFYVPMVPLSIATLATLLLVLRKVDIRNEGGAGLIH
jgi:AAHS family 4-hydroxybenzoate transporter-like MFS transporter